MPAFLRPIGPVLEAAYRFELGRRSRAFDRGRGVVTLDRPIVSVGNLSVGGTGKTPMVRRVVRTLREAGLDPAIAMRGYASRDGMSDEADEYRRSLDDVPVVAQPTRAEGLLDLFATERGERVDCVVLDDGFQHRKLARCFDLVLLDATRDVFADRLLPRGWLREGPDALARAHAVAITRADGVQPSVVREIAAKARAINPKLLIGAFRHAWTGLRVHDHGGAAPATQPLDWLRSRRLGVACAIGNPDAFLAMVRAYGAEPVDSVILQDHDAFEAPALKRVLELSQRCEALVITDKDWSKLSRVRPELWGCPVVVPQVEMQPIPGLVDLASGTLETAMLEAIRAFHA